MVGAAEQGWEWEVKYLYSSFKPFMVYKVIYAALQTGSGLRRSREAGFCQPARCNEAAMFSSCFREWRVTGSTPTHRVLLNPSFPNNKIALLRSL